MENTHYITSEEGTKFAFHENVVSSLKLLPLSYDRSYKNLRVSESLITFYLTRNSNLSESQYQELWNEIQKFGESSFLHLANLLIGHPIPLEIALELYRKVDANLNVRFKRSSLWHDTTQMYIWRSYQTLQVGLIPIISERITGDKDSLPDEWINWITDDIA